MFQTRCRAHKIIIERLHDGSIVAYRSDDREDSITVDTAQEPFDKLLRF
ncbi:MAG: hypothetical protein HQL09_06505 [Nitrospirae bacterium]|nr:hypothetical protein [Nitrospirota bacterium]